MCADVAGGPRTRLYSGAAERYEDRAAELQPWTEYEYLVEAFNSAGSFSSSWERVRTDAAPPDDVPAPVFKVQRPAQGKLADPFDWCKA